MEEVKKKQTRKNTMREDPRKKRCTAHQRNQNRALCPENSSRERKNDEGSEAGEVDKSCRSRGGAIDRLEQSDTIRSAFSSSIIVIIIIIIGI